VLSGRARWLEGQITSHFTSLFAFSK
jgi:hypothetical protein